MVVIVFDTKKIFLFVQKRQLAIVATIVARSPSPDRTAWKGGLLFARADWIASAEQRSNQESIERSKRDWSNLLSISRWLVVAAATAVV